MYRGHIFAVLLGILSIVGPPVLGTVGPTGDSSPRTTILSEPPVLGLLSLVGPPVLGLLSLVGPPVLGIVVLGIVVLGLRNQGDY